MIADLFRRSGGNIMRFDGHALRKLVYSGKDKAVADAYPVFDDVVVSTFAGYFDGLPFHGVTCGECINKHFILQGGGCHLGYGKYAGLALLHFEGAGVARAEHIVRVREGGTQADGTRFSVHLAVTGIEHPFLGLTHTATKN